MNNKVNEVKVNQVHTTCRHCVFADFDGKKQVGCKMDKLQAYKDIGVEVLEVFDDDDMEFCLINGRFCMFYRNHELMEKYPHDSWKDVVTLETKVPYQAIVFVEEDSTFVSIKQALQKLYNQKTKPNLVTVLNKQYISYSEKPDEYIRPSLILELLSSFGFHKYNLKNVYDADLSDRGLIDLVFDGTKTQPYPYYIVFRAGFDIPETFSEELNYAVITKLLQVGFASPVDDINGMVVNKAVHKKHGGNSFDIYLEDKISELEENAKNFLYKVEDICPSMSQQ